MIRYPGAAVAWWQDMQPGSEEHRRGDRAARARLRRCALVAEAMNEPATFILFRHLGADQPDDLVRVALTAAVLAHVRENAPEAKVARQIGPQPPNYLPESAFLKPLRFQRLMQAEEPDDRLIASRRLVALASGKINVRDLAISLLFWTEEQRRRWTYDYWGAGQPAASAKPADAKPGDDAA